jgi:hypothetical protein
MMIIYSPKYDEEVWLNVERTRISKAMQETEFTIEGSHNIPYSTLSRSQTPTLNFATKLTDSLNGLSKQQTIEKLTLLNLDEVLVLYDAGGYLTAMLGALDIVFDLDSRGDIYSISGSVKSTSGVLGTWREAESCTTTGTVVQSTNASRGQAVALDTQGEYAELDISQNVKTLEGAYLFYTRLKDSNAVSDDVRLEVEDTTSSTILASTLKSASQTYAYEVLAFDVPSSSEGHNIVVRVKKETATANTIYVDLLSVVNTYEAQLSQYGLLLNIFENILPVFEGSGCWADNGNMTNATDGDLNSKTNNVNTGASPCNTYDIIRWDAGAEYSVNEVKAKLNLSQSGVDKSGYTVYLEASQDGTTWELINSYGYPANNTLWRVVTLSGTPSTPIRYARLRYTTGGGQTYADMEIFEVWTE